MSDLLPTKQLDNFYKAASSLKLFSRAELNDEKNRTLIEKLYVDPLPNEQAFKILMSSSTVIIYGRKGTGKSTVFQRAQHEIRKNKSNIISAYMDIRNIYESSQIDQITVEKIEKMEGALSSDQIKKLLLYKKFFRALIGDIRIELKSQVDQSFLSKIKERVKGTSAEVFSGLDKILHKMDNPEYENIAGIISIQEKNKKSGRNSNKNSVSSEVKISSSSGSFDVKGSHENTAENSRESEEAYTQILMRMVGVNEIIDELKNILSALDIKYLYIFLDDFSELPEEAMKILVNSLVSPLTRWSDFIKFKIAAYPGRVYFGSIDKTKVEEFNFDMFGLYSSSGVNKMEEKAIDFVKRVVERRLFVFCKSSADAFFITRNDEIWRTLFYASMANPRIIGHIMLYAYESHLLYGKKIGIQSIQEAAQRYYEEKVATFFSTGQYNSSFHERSSIFSLKELLELLVSKARSIRQEDRGSKIGSRIFSSHFYISRDFEDLLSSLELSFFVSKYFEQSDRDGNKVSIYALNYGLCGKYQIGFGRPFDRREDRLYFVERGFDYNSVILSYMKSNQEITCDSCDEIFEINMLSAIKMFKMKCPKCQTGMCSVVNLSRKYEAMLSSIKSEMLLPETELNILLTLHNESREMVASEIAGELDCSGQLVGRRARNLSEKSLITRVSTGSVYKYELRPEAESAYFANLEIADLNVGMADKQR